MMRFLNFKIIIILSLLVLMGGAFVFFDFNDREDQDQNQVQLKNEETKDGGIEQGAYLFDMRIDGLNLNVELANTVEKRTIGLSGRKKMGNNQGMLFAFDSPGFYSFWMKDMNFPIDVIWISKNLKIVDITENVQPGSFPQKFVSGEMAQYVLEVNAGWTRDHKIEKGMMVYLEDVSPGLKVEENISDVLDETQPISSNVLEGEIGQSEQPANLNTGQQSQQNNIILLDVPFTSQAPFGGWADPRRENGCEETSALMAMAWVRGEKLSPEYADKKILEISDYEKNIYGDFHDTSAKDTISRIFNDYFKYDKADVFYDIDGEDIKRELEAGNLVIVPVHGQKLKNPYYTQPGPVQHMLVVMGYDEAKKQFITNDPGTRHGEKYRYGEDIFEAALQDYPSGIHEPIEVVRTAMVVVKK